jgi:hypothetical protein
MCVDTHSSSLSGGSCNAILTHQLELRRSEHLEGTLHGDNNGKFKF